MLLALLTEMSKGGKGLEPQGSVQACSGIALTYILNNTNTVI
jgi:hypothetical protein